MKIKLYPRPALFIYYKNGDIIEIRIIHAIVWASLIGFVMGVACGLIFKGF